MSPDVMIAAIAAKQHGVFDHADAIRARFTPDEIRHRVATGRWIAVYRGVYVLNGAPPTWEQNAIAAVLAYGPEAAASHTTSGYLLEIVEDATKPLHVSLPRAQHRDRRKPVIPHQATLGPRDIRMVNGIRVVGPERTLVDLAGVLSPRGLEAALDNAIQLGLTTVPRIQTYIAKHNLAHNRGVGRLRLLLEDRANGAMHRELERMFRRKLEASGFPKAKRQLPIAGYHADFAWPDAKVVVELDGLGGHFSAEKARRDKRRDRAVACAGFTTVRLAWDDVDKDWPSTKSDLRTLLASVDGRGSTPPTH